MTNLDINKLWSDFLQAQNQQSQQLMQGFSMVVDLAKQQGFVPPSGLPQQPVTPSPAPLPTVQQHQQQPQYQQLPPVLNIQEPRAPEPVKDQGSRYKTRIKADKPCHTCKFQLDCSEAKSHKLTPNCPEESWKQKHAAMNVNGELVIKMAEQGNDAVYQDGVFIGIHPKNKNTRGFRTMLEENFLGQDVAVFTVVDKKNPDSIYTNVIMDVIGSVAPAPVEQHEPVVVPEPESTPIPDGPLNLGLIEEEDELPV